MDVDAIEQALGAYLESHAEGAYAAYLFGSVAGGTARPDSGVDVAVLLDGGRPKTLAEMRTALVLRDVAENRLRDLSGFVESIRKRLPRC